MLPRIVDPAARVVEHVAGDRELLESPRVCSVFLAYRKREWIGRLAIVVREGEALHADIRADAARLLQADVVGNVVLAGPHENTAAVGIVEGVAVEYVLGHAVGVVLDRSAFVAAPEETVRDDAARTIEVETVAQISPVISAISPRQPVPDFVDEQRRIRATRAAADIIHGRRA